MSDPYEVDARWYDLWHARDPGDLGLWQAYAARTDRPVLEVGTGTGRVAISLALAGHEVLAVDPSAAMLAVARAKAEEAGLSVQFVEGRPAELALEAGRYGFVLVPADVFLYCQDGEEQLAMLRALGPALAFDGVLVVDLPGPAAGLDPTTNGQPRLVFAGETLEGESLDVWQVNEDDLALQRRWLRVTYECGTPDGGFQRWHSQHALRYVGRFEMEYLLRLAGLAPLEVYGDYDLGPLTSESERMIFIARSASG